MGKCLVVTKGFLASIGFLTAAGFLLSSQALAGGSEKKSLVIGIDGMGFGVQGFSVASTPWMDSLIAGTWEPGYQGAYSDQAFTGGVLGTPTEQATVSGPGWSTILTGVWRDQHGVNDNGATFTNGNFATSPRSGIPSNPPYLGSLEEALSNLYTASYVKWDLIDRNIIGSLDFDGVTGNDLDFHAQFGADEDVVSSAVTGIAGLNRVDPAAVFVSVDLVDNAGHSCGGSGLCYRQAIEAADDFVGRLLTTVTNRGNFANEDWQIVVTADHGFRVDRDHGGQSDLERTIPFMVASQSVRQGILQPGTGPPISHADVPPTVLDHFGIALPPNYWGASRAAGAPIPEPSTLTLVALVMGGLLARGWRPIHKV